MSTPAPEASAHVVSLGPLQGAGRAELTPLLASVHGEVLRKRARQVTLDLRGAGPLGVGGLQSFVGWILEIQDLPPAERYTVHVIGDSADHWQRRSLEALRACADAPISVSFVEGQA